MRPKIHWYEFSDGDGWRLGTSSFFETEIVRLAQQQPYLWRVWTTDTSDGSVEAWKHEDYIRWQFKAALEEEILKRLENI